MSNAARKSQTLGSSSSFARAGQARSVRRQLVDAAFGGGDPQQLELHLISSNPDNPRDHLGDLAGMASSLIEIGQIQAITVATVEAYLRDRPERESELQHGAAYVVVDGHRRLAAAREAGLPTLKVTVDDIRVSSDEALLEAAFVANAQRENLSDLATAQALQTLVDFYGSQRKAAKRLGMTQPNISQRLSLLSLSPELQADLQEGRRQVNHVRNLTSLSPQEQKAAADARAAQARKKSETRKTRSTPEPQPTEGHNSVITSAPEPRPTEGHNSVMAPRAGSHDTQARPQTHNSVMSQAGEERNAAAATEPIPPGVRWGNPHAVAQLLRQQMTRDDIAVLGKILTET